MCRELLDVVKFFQLDNGCQHLVAEYVLVMGKLICMQRPYHAKTCETKCSICSGDWSKTFLPIVKEKVVHFLESDHFSRNVPLLADGDKVVDVI